MNKIDKHKKCDKIWSKKYLVAEIYAMQMLDHINVTQMLIHINVTQMLVHISTVIFFKNFKASL